LGLDEAATAAGAGSWTTVAGPGTINGTIGQLKYLVDSTAGPVTVNLPNLFDEQVVIVKDWKGQAGAQGPITVNPPSGVTIENPANPGNQGSSALLDVQGQVATWQFVAALNQLVQIGS